MLRASLRLCSGLPQRALLSRPLLVALALSRSSSAQLEAAAAARKSKAEETRAQLEAEAAARRAKAEEACAKPGAHRLADRALRLRLVKGLVAIGALWLGYDHLTHSLARTCAGR